LSIIRLFKMYTLTQSLCVTGFRLKLDNRIKMIIFRSIMATLKRKVCFEAPREV